MNDHKKINLASRWKRLWGALLDCILGVVIVISVSRILRATGVLYQVPSQDTMPIGEQVILFLIGFAIFLILNGYLLFTKGQTIGKRIVKTRIVDPRDNVPNFSKLIIMRYLFFSLVSFVPIIGGLLVLGNLLFIFGKERRCIHDYMAATRVIDA